MAYTKKIIILALSWLTIFYMFFHLPVLASSLLPPSSIESVIRKDLSQRTGIKPEDFTLKSSASQTWPDGCLGLAKKDELCTQALVPGWQITLGYKNKTWTYRTDNSGRNIRSE